MDESRKSYATKQLFEALGAVGCDNPDAVLFNDIAALCDAVNCSGEKPGSGQAEDIRTIAGTAKTGAAQ